MKNISRWARANPIASRIIIALSHVLIAINAMVMAVELFALQWGEARWSIVLFANLFFILYVSYPKKQVELFSIRYTYVRQKLYDFSLVVLYSSILTFGVNNILIYASYDTYSVPLSNLKFISYRSVPENEIIDQKKLNIKESLRIKIKQEVRELAKDVRDPGKNSGNDGVKILLFLLSVAITLFLGALIAALSCNLACSGAEGLAAAVLILGWGGLLWLEIIAIKSIGKLHKNKKTFGDAENQK